MKESTHVPYRHSGRPHHRRRCGHIATTGTATANAGTEGASVGSPGVASGNLLQEPTYLQINLRGNTLDETGVLNPAAGNACVNR
ncbi:chaplin [Streptomyces sp. RB6PN25]|uniref:Chaplin n=1 Tax=Streptomyces humicola TaxID=2953240 RepID=A0ABT1PPV5_9ACTN|nr:chaplin [Streptomyces humicola]